MQKSASLVLLGALLCCSAVLNAQERQELENIKLSEAINLIGQHYKISFSYNPQIIPDVIIKKVKLKDQELSQVLTEILSPHELEYKIANSSVAIYKSKKIVTIKPSNEQIIKGYVVDNITKEPIPGVNVFISNTLIGEATDINGFFEFTIDTINNYELVASHITYEPKILALKSINNTEQIVIQLFEDIDELEEVVVRFSNRDWSNQFKDFRREFLGSTPNAAGCKILNPEVLHFQYDESSDLLTAYADDLLEIRNKALGYRVSHLLVHFNYQNGKVAYRSKAIFEKLTHKNKLKEKKWIKARDNAYLGSPNHFLKSLTTGDLKKEGYQIFITNSLNGNRERTATSPDSILIKTDSTYILDFDNYLEVVYKELEEPSYSHIRKSGYIFQAPLNRQTSILEINSPLGYTVIQNGEFLDPTSVIQHGYWGWKRTADLLPTNYKINEF